MIDAVKDYLTPKRFGAVAYVCVIIHLLCGLAFTAVTSVLRAGEIGKFTCSVDREATTAYKAFVEKTCYSRYEQTYNSPLPLYGFVLLSIGFTVLVSVIYSLLVSTRVDEVDRTSLTSNVSDEAGANSEETSHRYFVFYSYFFHLVTRSLFGILFTILQYTVFYPSGFDFEFICSSPVLDMTSQLGNASAGQFNATSITCENTTASEKQLWAVIVSVLNTLLSSIMLCEVIYLCRRHFLILNCGFEAGWRSDNEFIADYLFRKRITRFEHELSSVVDSTPLLSTAECIIQECINFYKQEVLSSSLSPDIYYAPNADVDDLYIDVVIHTGRARNIFSKEMKRHEIFDVYTKIPEYSIRLKKIKDLFYPRYEKGPYSRTILVVGRPGIGKTVLTEKIMRDWASGIDEFYCGKIVFLYKFRWFNIIDEFKNLSLKTFLRYGTGLREQQFESIFEMIVKQPEKAIFIFDGLDEFDGALKKCLDQSRGLPNDPNACMSGMNLFIKLVSGNILKGATLLVTSRPTADAFYSRLPFNRNVEIIGFTSNKIEEYVTRFCDNTNRSDLKPKIWNHIKSSTDLLNLCYIPVNSFIICVTLCGCLSDPRNDTGTLPTTLTELYKAAVDHFSAHHDRNLDDTSLEQTFEKLQRLAFHGIEKGQLVFEEQEFDEKIRKVGLVNSSSNPIHPIQTQFCFIHLTIQEFLAAKHVTETLSPDKIKEFISTNIKSAKWYLVFQFIAGLLGKKIKMSGSVYRECVLSFAKRLPIRNGEIYLSDNHIRTVIHCLREVDDETVVKQACERTDFSLITRVTHCWTNATLSTSEWASVTFFCKHLKNLKDLDFRDAIREDNYLLVVELLQQRCLESLMLENKRRTFNSICVPDTVGDLSNDQLISALMNSKCTLNHEHTKLSHLNVSFGVTDACVSTMSAAIRDGHASHLEILELSNCDISDKSAGLLCNALTEGNCDLTKLVLRNCSLTANCIQLLCKVLCDEYCNLTDLSLAGNAIGDDGVRVLCTDALRREQCKVTKLSLTGCSLTDQCVPFLCETLQDENCKLTELSIGTNRFVEECKSLLSHVKDSESCKARNLEIKVW